MTEEDHSKGIINVSFVKSGSACERAFEEVDIVVLLFDRFPSLRLCGGDDHQRMVGVTTDSRAAELRDEHGEIARVAKDNDVIVDIVEICHLS
jgi:hypothetical protein